MTVQKTDHDQTFAKGPGRLAPGSGTVQLVANGARLSFHARCVDGRMSSLSMAYKIARLLFICSGRPLSNSSVAVE